jgi:hypothetical protein
MSMLQIPPTDLEAVTVCFTVRNCVSRSVFFQDMFHDMFVY